MVFRLSESACGPFRSGFSVACSLIIFLLVFKARCLGVCLSCAGSRRWGAWCEAQIPVSSGKKFLPLWSLPIVDCHGWGVGFSLVRPSLCLSYPSPCCPLPFVVDSVHLVFTFLSEEIILHVVVDVLCQGRRWVQDLPTLPSWSCLSCFLTSCAGVRQAGFARKELAMAKGRKGRPRQVPRQVERAPCLYASASPGQVPFLHSG